MDLSMSRIRVRYFRALEATVKENRCIENDPFVPSVPLGAMRKFDLILLD
jgi:hypothetical protein